MKAYENYIDTGISWLKNIPSHWNTFRFIDNVNLKHGFQFRDYDFTDSGLKIIKISQLSPDGVLNLTDCSFISTNRLQAFRTILIKKGDILMALTGGTIGKIIRVGEVKEPLLQNYRVGNFFPKPNQLNKTFTYYLLAAQITEEQINYLLNRNGQPNIGKESFKNMFFPQPPIEEQTAIATYLDTKTQAIDKKVSLLEKKIGYYQELRKSLINETVTKGLDKNVKLKDSGIDWIGQIPEHWEVKRLKDVTSKMGSGSTPNSSNKLYYENGTINWLNTGDLNDGFVNYTKHKISQAALDSYPNMKMFEKGTLVFALYGATIGKLGLLEIETTSNQACCCMSFKKSIDPIYIFNWFTANKKNIISLSVGGTQPNVSQGILSFLKITIPPLKEQREIVNHLVDKTNKIDQIITNIQTQVSTLKELRKTLINDVVTGKIKVFEATENKILE